jgi:hypothetical protein
MREPLETILARFDDTAPLDRAWTIPGDWYSEPRGAPSPASM